MSDRSQHVDRCYQLLADRRRRFCLYHLTLANEPLSLRDLARAVEASLAPPEATVTERILNEAVRQLVHTHLPKLRDAGLVQMDDGYVEIAPDPTLPFQEWLAITASAELGAAGRQDQWRERHSTGDRNDEAPANFEPGNDHLSSLIGTSQ